MSSLKLHKPSLHPEFFAGRNPPDMHPDSIQYIDWWNEQIHRCLFGLNYKGRKVTGSYYHYLNFYKMDILTGQGKDKLRRYTYPYACDTDEFVFEALEDCHRAFQTFMMFTSGGTGKCLGINTLVRMYDGSLKKVQDIQIGDQIMGVDSTPRNVINTHSGYDNLYEVVQNKGMSYTVNSRHTLSLHRNKDCYCYEIVKGVKKSYMKYPQYGTGDTINIDVLDYDSKSKSFKETFSGYKTETEYPEKEIDIDPYFLGLWLGDGSSHSPAITTIDEPIEKYIYDFADSWNLKVTKNCNSKKSAPTYTISSGSRDNKSNPLKSLFHKLNLTNNKHIPFDYLINSKANRLKLLAGLIDSDGYKADNYYAYTSKSKVLIDDVKQLCDTLGFKTVLKEKTKNIKSINFSGQYFELSISGYLDEVPVLLERKKIKTSPNKNPRITRINEIKPKGYGEYFGFTLDGDQLFLLEDNTVTHNSSMLASYVQREFTFFPRSYSLVTASSDTPAMALMKYIEDSLDALPKALKHELNPHNKFSYLASNTLKKDGEIDPELSYASVIEKIVFGDKSGAARSKRPSLFIMEEIGDWTGGADLIDCYNASTARGKMGGEKNCLYAMIGTGGKTRNNVIKHVKTMIDEPESYNLYLCDPWKSGEKSIFFIPAFKKAFGFYEETGIMDQEGARLKFEAERAAKKDPRALLAEKREFPFTLKECFLKEVTGGIFYPDKLDYQYRRITSSIESNTLVPERGWWRKNDIAGYPDWDPDPEGPVWLYEKPHKDFPTSSVRQSNLSSHINGVVPPNLYTGGYDGIDMAKAQSASDNGSKGALWIKKRTTGISMTNNLYVLKINWRPEHDPDDLYEQVMFSAIAFDCKINIEHSKIGVIKFFDQNGQKFRLMKRPKSVSGNHLEEQSEGNKDLIGTIPSAANIQYGIGLLRKYVFDHYQNIFDLEFLEQLGDFTYEDKGLYDLIMAALWTEVGDEALPIFINRPAFQQKVTNFGWYIDPVTGLKVYGAIPEDQKIGMEEFTKHNAPMHSLLIDAHLYENQLNQNYA